MFQKIICLNNADSTDDSNTELTDEELSLLMQDDFYSKLACSLAPEIYGLEDVKKALLLLLVGGTDKKKGDIKIRGKEMYSISFVDGFLFISKI